MSRIASVLVLVLFGQVAFAADLPPGALVRLGDDRFRAGSAIEQLAISPDGKQFATVRSLSLGIVALTLWDATTGRPVREHKLNYVDSPWNRLGVYQGMIWNEAGGFAIHLRIEPITGGEEAQLSPDDFRIWEFTDPKAPPPPVFPTPGGSAGQPAVGRTGAKSAYTDFQFSGDGRRVAAVWKSGDDKFAVQVFEVKAADSAAKLKRVGVIDLGAEGTDAVRLSGDGKTLVTFRALKPAVPNGRLEESTATVWDVATGKPERPVRVPHSIAPLLTPDARELLGASWSEKERSYDAIDLQTGKQRKLIRWLRTDDDEPDGASHQSPVLASGRVLVVPNSRSVVIADLTTGASLGRLKGHTTLPTAVAVSADGTRIATADEYGLIRLWDAKTLRPLNDATGHRQAIEFVQLSPDGKRVLTWAADETVRLWDLATGKELRALSGAPWVWSSQRGYSNEPTFTPDGTSVLYSTNDRLIARDLQTGLEVPLPGDLAKLGPRLTAFAPDGKAVLTRDLKERSCEVWDWPSGKKRFSWKDDADRFAPGFSSDGAFVFTDLTSVERRDAKTGEKLPPVWKEPHPDSVFPLYTLRSSPRAGLLYQQTREALVFEAGTGKSVSRFRVGAGWGLPSNSYQHVSLSPTGGQYAWGSHTSDEVFLYESATCEVRRVLTGHRGYPLVLGFTPDGSRLLTAGGDHTVLVWDMRLQNVPLSDALKKETDASKLWESLATGKADVAYLAMARLAREPDAAVKLVKMKLKPIAKADETAEQTNLADARAIELLEALDLDDARTLLKELASGHADAFRTQEAKRALERNRAVTR